jgi:peptidoglycan/LPS O-acetylase OafA/YrhL
MVAEEPARDAPDARRRSSPPEIRPLTSLRFFACLAVFLHHCVDFGVPAQRFARAGVYGILWQGWSGVGFFFVLSGFILAYTYADRPPSAVAGGVVRFYFSRFARIYPLCIATFLLAAIPTVGQLGRVDPARVLTVASQLTLTQAWLPLGDPFSPGQFAAFAFNGPAWSLSCEAFFYLVFPSLLAVLVPRRPSALLIFAGGAWAFEASQALIMRGSGAVAGWQLYVFPPVRLSEFVIGICIGLVFIRLRTSPAAESRRWTLIEMGSIAAIVTAVLASRAVPVNFLYGAYYAPAFAALIVVFAAQRGALSRRLSSPLLVRLGEASFAFYLLQVLIFRAAGATGLYAAMPAAVVIAGIFSLTLALSLLVHHRFERPMRGLLRARLHAFATA